MNILAAVEEGMLGNSKLMCLCVYCLTVSQILVSCLLLMAIAVERYLAVSRPFKHHAYFTTNNAAIIIGTCWLYAFVVGSLPLYGWNALGIRFFDAFSSQEGLATNYASSDIEQNRTIPQCVLLVPFNIVINATNNSKSASFATLPLANGNDGVDTVANYAGEFECRFHNVMRGSYVAFVYPSHFIPLWILMTALYSQIYCRSRSQLQATDSSSELRRSRGTSQGLITAGYPQYSDNRQRRKSHGDCHELINRSSNNINSINNNNSKSQSARSSPIATTRSNQKATKIVNERRRHSVGVVAAGIDRINLRQGTPTVSRRKVENWHAARILALLVGFFVLSWSPLVLWYFTLFRGFTIEYARDVEPLLPKWMYNVAVCLVFGNSAVNPFLYGLGNRSVRRAWLKTFHCSLSTPESTLNGGTSHHSGTQLPTYRMAFLSLRDSRHSPPDPIDNSTPLRQLGN